MYRTDRPGTSHRRRALFIIALVAVAGLTLACGAGQITQTGTQQAAINGSNARLVAVQSPAATSLSLDGPEQAREILPGTALAAGQPIEQLDIQGPDQPVTVRGEFPADAIRPGLTHPVTFTFERAGTVTLQVPFDAWAPGEPLPTARPLPPLPAAP